MEKKVNDAEQSGRSDKPSSSKINNESRPHKVKQDNNSPTRNVSSGKGSQASQGTKRVSLEETIRKIIQSELENFLPYILKRMNPSPSQLKIRMMSSSMAPWK
ncbi:unnamed protein product [Rhizophagus irregularis]|nr:unnamed protein product [Rhizophagus irregularis]